MWAVAVGMARSRTAGNFTGSKMSRSAAQIDKSALPVLHQETFPQLAQYKTIGIHPNDPSRLLRLVPGKLAA
jgi:hypothetical protein